MLDLRSRAEQQVAERVAAAKQSIAAESRRMSTARQDSQSPCFSDFQESMKSSATHSTPPRYTEGNSLSLSSEWYCFLKFSFFRKTWLISSHSTASLASLTLGSPLVDDFHPLRSARHEPSDTEVSPAVFKVAAGSPSASATSSVSWWFEY